MFHKEGYQIIITSFILVAVIAVLAEYKISLEWLRMMPSNPSPNSISFSSSIF
jgi:hypothetical protein